MREASTIAGVNSSGLVNFSLREQVLKKTVFQRMMLNISAQNTSCFWPSPDCSPRPFIHYIATEHESVGEETQLAPILSIYLLYFLRTYSDDARQDVCFTPRFFPTCDLLSAANQIVLQGTINKVK